MCNSHQQLRLYERLRMYEHTYAVVRTHPGVTRRGFVYAVDPETGNVALLMSQGKGLCLVAATQVVEVVQVHDEEGEIFLPTGTKKAERGGGGGEGSGGGGSDKKGQSCGDERTDEDEEGQEGR